jgi:hypothetical protein
MLERAAMTAPLIQTVVDRKTRMTDAFRSEVK